MEFLSNQIKLKQNFKKPFLNEVKFAKMSSLLKEFKVIRHSTKNKISGKDLFFFKENFIVLFEQSKKPSYSFLKLSLYKLCYIHLHIF